MQRDLIDRSFLTSAPREEQPRICSSCGSWDFDPNAPDCDIPATNPRRGSVMDVESRLAAVEKILFDDIAPRLVHVETSIAVEGLLVTQDIGITQESVIACAETQKRQILEHGEPSKYGEAVLSKHPMSGEDEREEVKREIMDEIRDELAETMRANSQTFLSRMEELRALIHGSCRSEHITERFVPATAAAPTINMAVIPRLTPNPLSTESQRPIGVQSDRLNARYCQDAEVMDFGSAALHGYVESMSAGTRLREPDLSIAPSIPRQDVRNSVGYRILSSRDEISWSEMELQASVWDALVFVQTGIMSIGEDVAMILLALVNFLIQSLFISAVRTSMITGVFNQQGVVQALQDWRVTYAHDPKYADAINSIPLASSVCSHNPFTMEGPQLANRFKQIDVYLRTLSFGYNFHSGTLLCTLANLLWIFTCIREGNRCVHFVSAVWVRVYDSGNVALTGLQRLLSAYSVVFVKQAARTSVAFMGEVKSEPLDMNISFARGMVLTWFVFVPRSVVLCILAVSGVQFLVATIELHELILNAVALEVILTVDEMVHELFVPKTVQTSLSRMRPFRLPRAPLVFTRASPWLKLGSVAGLLAFLRYGGLFLDPLIRNLEDALHVMCGGNLDFLAFETAVGPVAAGKANESTIVNRTSYAYRAILQRTGLQGSCSSSCLYLDSDQGATPFPIRNAVIAQHLKTLTIKDIANQRVADTTYGVHCHGDLAWVKFYGVATKEAIFASIKGTVNDPRASSCAYLKRNAWCMRNNPGGAVTRFFCPHTCRCNDPSSGIPYLDPQYGVPFDCYRVLGNQLITMPCEDRNISVAPSVFASAANGYVELMAGSATKMSNGNTTHRNLILKPFVEFGKHGCPWLVQWDDPAKYIRRVGAPANANVSLNVPAMLCSIELLTLLGKWRTARFLCPVACGCTTKMLQAKPGMRFMSVASKYQGTNWTTGIGASSNCPKQCFDA